MNHCRLRSSLNVVSLRLRSSCALLFWISVLLLFDLAAQTTPRGDPPYEGGDSSLLTWLSSQRLDRAGEAERPPRYTYIRTVENHSAQDVTDIHWPVAGYLRKVIPPHTPLTDRVPLLGSLQVPPPRGPLHYGPGRAYYNTQVYAPANGWTSNDGHHSAVQSFKSELQVAIREANTYNICTVGLTSDVSQSADGTQYKYQFSNSGASTLQVFWNVPGSKPFREQFRDSKETPLVISPRQSVARVVTLKQGPAFYLSTVFINDSNGNLVGRSIVGVWASVDAERTIRLEDEWRE